MTIEIWLGCNPNSADSDGDGLTDIREIDLKPYRVDTPFEDISGDDAAPSELRFPKGSTWVLDVEDGQVVRGRYLPAT